MTKILSIAILSILVISCREDSPEYDEGIEDWKIAFNAHKEGNYVEAYDYYQKAYFHLEECKCYRDLSILAKDMGIMFDNLNMSKQAQNFYKKALEIVPEKDIELSIKYELAKSLRISEKYIEAMQLLTEIYPEAQDKLKLDIRNRIGVTFHYMEMYDKSNEVYWKLYNESEGSKYQEKYQGKALFNIANNYLDSENYQEAYEYFNRATRVTGYTDSSKLAYVYEGIGETHLNNKEYKKAIDALFIAESYKNPGRMQFTNGDVYRYLANSYKGLGDYESSSHYFGLYETEIENYNRVKRKVEKENEQLMGELVYDLFESEQDRAKLLADQKIYYWIIGIFSILSLIGIYKIYNLSRKTKSLKANVKSVVTRITSFNS